MSILTIIQARMSSQRLPGKVLMNINDKPILQHVVDAAPDPKIVAVGRDKQADKIIDYCWENDIHCIAGPVDDVLGRFYKAWSRAKELSPPIDTMQIDWILRLTADCPMLTSEFVARFFVQCIGIGKNSDTIYTNRPYDPDGYDMELFSVEALKMAHEHACAPEEREHVTPWMYKHLNVRRFSIMGRPVGPENPEEKCSVDTLKDYEKVKKLMEAAQ